jgi:hypothetical protein
MKSPIARLLPALGLAFMLTLTGIGVVSGQDQPLTGQSTAGAGWNAAWRSLVLPGWGQRLQGQTTYANVLVGLEVAFWSGILGWNAYEDWRLADSRRWSALNAGVDLSGKDGRFFEAMAYYPDMVTYNAAQLSGLGDPDLAYPASQGYEWRWGSEANWRYYRKLRGMARRADNLATLALGGVVAVRLVGAASALITGRRRMFGSADDGAAASRRAVPSRLTFRPWFVVQDRGMAAGLRWEWRH